MNGKGQSLPVCALIAVLVSAMLASMASNAGAWATITVNSLADPGARSICALRDAITAANTMTATNGCIAGKGNDTIQFSVTGTIKLVDMLPEITDGQLTINGPASPGITISGDDKVPVMGVSTILNLDRLTIAHGNGGLVGGIYNGGNLTVTNSTFSNNSATATTTEFLGVGGIVNVGTLTVINSTFSNNSGGDAGGIGNFGFDATVSNCTFSGNTAGNLGSEGKLGGGGGIRNGGNLTVTNSTFSNNSNGIFNYSAMVVTNSSFLSNGVSNVVNAFTKGALHGTILAGQVTSGDCVNELGAFVQDLGYNISNDDSCGFTATGSLNNTDPQLDPSGLASNGGPTQTIALLSGSPAIDAIPLASCTDRDGNPLTTDQRGFPRPDNGESLCDIGAYEFQDFAGDPGRADCFGKSMSELFTHHRSPQAAASAMGFGSVRALQTAIRTFCKG